MPSGPLLLDGRLDSRLLVLLFGQRFLDTTTTQKGPLLWGQKRSSMGSSMRNFKQVLQLIFFYQLWLCLCILIFFSVWFGSQPVKGTSTTAPSLGPGPCPSLRLRRRRHSRRTGWPALRRRRGAEVEVREGVGLRWIASCRGRVLLGSLDSHPID